MDDERLLRRYLTGTLAEEEADEVDLWILVDDNFFAAAEEIEHDLLADYARGGLAPLEAAGLRRRCAASPQGRARLSLAEGLTALHGSRLPLGLDADGTQKNSLERCEALLALSRSLRPEEPQEAVRLALLATDVAARLDRRQHGASAALDLLCRAKIELAEACGLAERHPDAERSLSEAEALLPRGLPGRRLRARLFEVKAALAGGLRRFPEVLAAADTAFEIYRNLGDDHAAGRVLLTRSVPAVAAQDLSQTLRRLKRGLSLLDSVREPRTFLLGIQGAAECLVEMAEYRRARGLLRRNLARYEQDGGALDRSRLRWLQGRVAAALEEWEPAESHLSAARAGFLAAGLTATATFAALNLAEVHLRREETEKARGVVHEAAEACRAPGITPEVTAAVLFLEEAFVRRSATAALLRSVSDFLRRAEHDPDAKFSPPALNRAEVLATAYGRRSS